MYLASVYYPEIHNEKFHAFRDTYDPFYKLIPPHVSFIFPLPEKEVGLQNFKNHIRKVLEPRQPFEAHFRNLEKTWDHWLMLTPENGYNKIKLLHDELYSGILAPYLRKDLPFTPHIGLGLFSKEQYDFNNPGAALTLDENKYRKAVEEFKTLDFDIRFTIDKLTLLKINEQFTRLENIAILKM